MEQIQTDKMAIERERALAFRIYFVRLITVSSLLLHTLARHYYLNVHKKSNIITWMIPMSVGHYYMTDQMLIFNFERHITGNHLILALPYDIANSAPLPLGYWKICHPRATLRRLLAGNCRPRASSLRLYGPLAAICSPWAT